MVGEYKSHGKEWYCSDWKINQQSPRVGHGEVCMLPSIRLFQFYQFF